MIGIIGLNFGVAIRCVPVSGGGVAHALSAGGRVHCAIAGWSLALGYSSIVALNASAVPLIFRSLQPNSNSGLLLYTVAGWDVYLSDVVVSSISIIVFALVATRGASISGRFQFIVVSVMTITVLALLLWTLADSGYDNLQYSQSIPEGRSLFAAAGMIIAIAPWAYVGFDSIPQLAGEFSFSPEKARRLILIGIFGATLIYISMIFVVAMLTGNDANIFQSSAWPIAEAVSSELGEFGLLLLIVAVSGGIVTGLNGFYAASSRTLMTMGRAGILPGKFARLDRVTQTPTVAIYTVMLLCLITPWFGRAALSWVVDMASVGITVAYFYTSLCVRQIGKEGTSPGMKERLAPSSTIRTLGTAGCVLSIVFLTLLLFPGTVKSCVVV